MLLYRSLPLKVLATALTAVAFSLVYQATVIDSRPGMVARVAAAEGRLPFIATAYCRGETTASGVTPQAGIAAADPRLLPEGSVIQVDGAPARQSGIYTVLDTGPKVQGSHVDLYMWSCNEAVAFGRRNVVLTVLRRGWQPNGATARR
jgi:3D (Asp-Asp-Asp) domain-containing protein